MKCRGKRGFIKFGTGTPPMIRLPVVAGVVGGPEGAPDENDLTALCSGADLQEEVIGDTIAPRVSRGTSA
jgi:hypothetical protein